MQPQVSLPLCLRRSPAHERLEQSRNRDIRAVDGMRQVALAARSLGRRILTTIQIFIRWTLHENSDAKATSTASPKNVRTLDMRPEIPPSILESKARSGHGTQLSSWQSAGHWQCYSAMAALCGHPGMHEIRDQAWKKISVGHQEHCRTSHTSWNALEWSIPCAPAPAATTFSFGK
jgi:hypothetical protein